jgi:Ser/Thr protein kinase RdoA (MazF antagonist)
VLIDLQISSIDRLGELRLAGVPDRRWDALLGAAEAVVLRRAPGDKVLRRLLDGAERRIATIDECGLPFVLVHGDAHSGNARTGPGADPGIWFDWGDCRIGHPLIDVAVLLRAGTEHADPLIAHWLDGWKRALPGTDPHRAWELVKPLAALGNAVVYQGFLDAIEASEQPYHVNDVLPCLAEAAEMTEGSPAAGDPACWAGLVCPECGAVASEGHRQRCESGHVEPGSASR